MTLAAGLAVVDVLVVDIADLADAGHAVQRDVAHLAGGQAHQGVAVLFRHQLGHVAGRAHQLRALAGIQLDVVDDGAHGDGRERQAVARLDVGVGAVHDGVAHLEALGGDDVALHAVLILDQGDVGRAVGVVLEGLDRRGDVELVALEVHHAVLGAVAAAVMAHGDAAGVVAAAVVLHRLEQAPLGLDLGKDRVIGDRHAAAARSSRFVLFNGHCYLSFL